MDTKGQTAPEPAALTPDRAHALLGVRVISRASFHNAINRGEVPRLRLGNYHPPPFLPQMAGDGQPWAGGGALMPTTETTITTVEASAPERKKRYWNSVPDAMKQERRWLLWKYERRDGAPEPTKVP